MTLSSADVIAFPREPTPPARACGFCGRELNAIELWHSPANCEATRIAHANHVLEHGIRAEIQRIDELMTRHLHAPAS